MEVGTLTVVEQDERQDTDHLRHILPPKGNDSFWCGTSRDVSKPVRWKPGPVDCVVCEDLYRSLGAWWTA